MVVYRHRVQYYETDRMGVTHHSNYIRWMEEARGEYFNQIGWNYADLEKRGFISPVLKAEAEYHLTTTYDDVVSIEVYCRGVQGIRYHFAYRMLNATGKLVCSGQTEHCFIDREGKLLRVDRLLPELWDKLAVRENKV